jgi:hypothetical protein
MLAGERLLDCALALAKPVERDIEFILVNVLKAEQVAKAGGSGGRIEHAGGRELGGRRDQPSDDHGDDQITAAVADRTQHAIKSDGAQRAEHGRDMAVGQRAANDDGLLIGRRDLAALEQCAQSFDQFARPVGEVGDGALLDRSAIPKGLAQQDGGRRIAVGDRLDVHGNRISHLPQQ